MNNITFKNLEISQDIKQELYQRAEKLKIFVKEDNKLEGIIEFHKNLYNISLHIIYKSKKYNAKKTGEKLLETFEDVIKIIFNDMSESKDKEIKLDRIKGRKVKQSLTKDIV